MIRWKIAAYVTSVMLLVMSLQCRLHHQKLLKILLKIYKALNPQKHRLISSVFLISMKYFVLTICSGGSKIYVHGKRLDSVSMAKMIVYIEGQSVQSVNECFCDLCFFTALIFDVVRIHQFKKFY